MRIIVKRIGKKLRNFPFPRKFQGKKTGIREGYGQPP